MRQLGRSKRRSWGLVGRSIGQLAGSTCCRDSTSGGIRMMVLRSMMEHRRIPSWVRSHHRSLRIRWRVRMTISCISCIHIRARMLASRSSRGQGSVCRVPGWVGGLALRRRGLGLGLWWGGSMWSRLGLGKVVCSRRRLREWKGEAL